ncbi:PREDICTED: uncharacterized protein LOC109213514 [Nicotiana attenuata]|uniref:uncharacterized protein LOC109213514 n=1 Tax=Nicotiana attenuata TaxID=49451 RepID=UPI000905CF93|nr:PREDICTED: uncharacterized protein LOC109213514 [Nicotiana attenuata]
MGLTYVPPMIQNGEKIVELQQEEVEKETEKWKMAVIMYVVRDTPSIGAVERFIAFKWNFVTKPKVYYRNEGYFVVKFSSIEERNEVLYSGPSTINSRPVITKAWAPDFDFEEEVLKTLPLWVKLPNLHLNCWGADSLSRIGSGLGTPIYADECTTKVERISYARILVEMDITRPLPMKITVKDPNGRKFEQAVTYDWKPVYCSTCLQLGHNCLNKTPMQQLEPKQTKQRQEWKPKEQNKPSTRNEGSQDTEARKQPETNQEITTDTQNHQHSQDTKEKWQEVRGKSAAKQSHVTTTEERLVMGNGFTALTRASTQQININTGRMEGGQCSRGRMEEAIFPDQICYDVGHMECRIWIVWEPNEVAYTTISYKPQYIHGEATLLASRQEFTFTAIYGLHTVDARKSLWADLLSWSHTQQKPWLCMGDFNAVLSEDDRSNGSPIQEWEVRDFKEFMLKAGMTEMRIVGRSFTRTNSHVFSRIDRVVVNSEWITKMPHLDAMVMNPYFSDHSPLCIKFGEEPQNFRPFRFFNHLADHKEFLQIVTNAWTGKETAQMSGIWRKLKAVKGELKKLNTTEFAAVDKKVKHARQQLQEIQEKIRNNYQQARLFEEEKGLKKQLEKWVNIEESIFKQKSKNQWLKLGDSNSAFFFANMKSRISQTKIRSLMTTTGEIVQTMEAIEKEIVDFYKELLGSSATALPAIHPRVMKEGKMLNRKQQLKLIEPVREEEVYNALKNIDDLKAPGCDRFNLFFFKKSWGIIGKEITKAV